MSGTDFYYQPQIDLAHGWRELAPGQITERVFFDQQRGGGAGGGVEAGALGTRIDRGAIAFFGGLPWPNLWGDVAVGIEAGASAWVFAAGA